MSILSRIFKRVNRKVTHDQQPYGVIQSASFKDLTGKQVELEIRTNGNDKLLMIKVENENQTAIQIDQEKAILLSILVQSYAAHDVFPDLSE